MASDTHAEDESRSFARLRRVAIASIVLIGFGTPLYSLYERYFDQQRYVQELADTQAVIVGRYASANPDSWMFKAEHLAIHLKGIRPENTKTIIEFQDKPIIEIGVVATRYSIERAREFSVHGQVAGRVRVAHPMDHFERDTVMTIGFGILVSAILLGLLSYSVTRPMRAAVMERERLTRELMEQARNDYLTGISNRREFVRLAELAIRSSARYDGPLSLLMMDIDHFKRINDQYGHKSGDSVLVRLAEVCKSALRDVDVFGRIGGEEFAILLPHTAGADAFQVADRLRLALAQEAVTITSAGSPLNFTVSIGVAELTPDQATLETLLGRADEALYRAKDTGRNKVCIAETQRRREHAPDLHDAQSTAGA